jgi:hypothetical protein
MSGPMGFVEFPKWLYRGDREAPEGCLVYNAEEQALFVEDGWKTVELFHVEQAVVVNTDEEKRNKKVKK